MSKTRVLLADDAPEFLKMATHYMNGIEATRQIKSMPSAPIVVILTGHDTPEYRSAAAGAGAKGFVYKLELFHEPLPLMHRLAALSCG